MQKYVISVMLMVSVMIAGCDSSNTGSVEVTDELKKQQAADEKAATDEEMTMPGSDGSPPVKNKSKTR
jgi:major membrane immunogen (membrane-anchored lipoprotein)